MSKIFMAVGMVLALSACSKSTTVTSTSNPNPSPPQKKVPFEPGEVNVVDMKFEPTNWLTATRPDHDDVRIMFLSQSMIKKSDLQPKKNIAIDFSDPSKTWDDQKPVEHKLATLELGTVVSSANEYSATFEPIADSDYKIESVAINKTRISISRARLEKAMSNSRGNLVLKVSYHLKLQDLQSLFPNRQEATRQGTCCSSVKGMERAGSVLILLESPNGKTVAEISEDSSKFFRAVK